MCLGAINISPRGLSGKFQGPLSSPSLDFQGSHRVQSENPALRKHRSSSSSRSRDRPLLASSQMPVRSHGRTTAVCRPEQFSTLCLEKKKEKQKWHGGFLICSHRSFYTRRRACAHNCSWPAASLLGHQRDKCFSRLLCSCILCGLVENWFKLVNQTPIVPPLALW